MNPKASLSSPGSGTNDCCWVGCNTSKTLSVVNGKVKSTRIALPSCNSNLACLSWWYVIHNMTSSYFFPKTNNNLNTEHCKKWRISCIYTLHLDCQLCNCTIYKMPQEMAVSFSFNFLTVPCLVSHTGPAQLQRFDITLTTMAISESTGNEWNSCANL